MLRVAVLAALLVFVVIPWLAVHARRRWPQGWRRAREARRRASGPGAGRRS